MSTIPPPLPPDASGPPPGDQPVGQPGGQPAGPPPLPTTLAGGALTDGPVADGPDREPAAAVRPAPAARFAACPTCGSQVTYAPGTTALKCSACGAEHAIEAGEDTVVEEHSFDEWMGRNSHVEVATLGGQVLRCQGCAAEVETTDLAETCQFCSGHLVALTAPEGVVAPEAVVPFAVPRKGAQEAFQKWIGSRWFAPNALKKIGSTESLKGTYVPHWTFDAETASDYDGERGEHYYVTKTRQVPDGKGGTRTETYQEQHTRWHRAYGHVERAFDDVTVPASQRVPAKQLGKMGPWKLETAVAYQPEYLSGYSALRYDVDPQAGSTSARAEMRSVIEDDVRRDIGGDEQRVHRVDVEYARVMFKLVLLPLWLATYVHAGKQWQVMVNANTGEVTGDRPWSVMKIVLTVLSVLAVIAIVLGGLAVIGDSSTSP